MPFFKRFELVIAGTLLLALCLPGVLPAHAAPDLPQDARAATILVYHRISDDPAPGGASLGPDLFDQHVRELTTGAYKVLPLPVIITALKEGKDLEGPAIGLTFDGGDRQTVRRAMEKLDNAGLPFTVFLSTDAMDRGDPGALSWDEARRLARNPLVTLGLHPASYARLYDLDPAEMARQVNKAVSRYREELGRSPALFAYPYGEYSGDYRDLIEKLGFAAAFGQHSGVAYEGSDLFALPRFSMTGPFGSLERFQMVARALPLPVTDITPADPLLREGTPVIGFTVDPALQAGLKTLSCFASTAEKMALDTAGDTRIEMRLKGGYDDTRLRINCTMPGPGEGEDMRWRWFGMMLLTPLPYAEQPAAGDSDPARNAD